MNPFILGKALFGAASTVAVASVSLNRQRRLTLLEENRRMLLTYFRPLQISEKAEDASVFVNFRKKDFIEIQRVLKELEALDHGI